jgi:hypothetical protein
MFYNALLQKEGTLKLNRAILLMYRVGCYFVQSHTRAYNDRDQNAFADNMCLLNTGCSIFTAYIIRKYSSLRKRKVTVVLHYMPRKENKEALNMYSTRREKLKVRKIRTAAHI